MATSKDGRRFVWGGRYRINSIFQAGTKRYEAAAWYGVNNRRSPVDACASTSDTSPVLQCKWRGDGCAKCWLFAGALGLPALRPVLAHPFADRLPGRWRHSPTTWRRRGTALGRRSEASGTAGAGAAVSCLGTSGRTGGRCAAAEVGERAIDLGELRCQLRRPSRRSASGIFSQIKLGQLGSLHHRETIRHIIALRAQYVPHCT